MITVEEQIVFLESCSKEQFINFAKEFNIFKTTLEPNYLLIRDKIIMLLSKFELQESDVQPNPRILQGSIKAGYCKV